MNDPQNDEAERISRRMAINRLWQLGGLTVSVASGLIGLQYVGSRAIDTPFGKVVDAGKAADFSPASVTAFPQARFFLVRAAEGGFLALYHKCTHLACTVIWRAEGQAGAPGYFLCPCHGSQFEADGAVRKAPAPIPLVRFPVTFDADGRVHVDTGHPIARTATDPADFAYAPEIAP